MNHDVQLAFLSCVSVEISSLAVHDGQRRIVSSMSLNSSTVDHRQRAAAIHNRATAESQVFHSLFSSNSIAQPLCFTDVTHRVAATIDSRRVRFSTTAEISRN